MSYIADIQGFKGKISKRNRKNLLASIFHYLGKKQQIIEYIGPQQKSLKVQIIVSHMIIDIILLENETSKRK